MADDEAVTSAYIYLIHNQNHHQNEAQKHILTSWQNHWDEIPTSNKLRNIKKPVSKSSYPENASRREQIITELE